MKNSRQCLLVLFAAAVLGVAVPRVASAEPVTITSGFISIPVGCCTARPIQLEGTDGVLPFSLRGSISPDSYWGLKSGEPRLPTATTISLDIYSLGLDLPGMVTYGDDSYFVGGLEETSGNIVFQLSGFTLLPPAPSTLDDVATVTGSFELLATSHFSPPCCGRDENDLRGSGMATVSLFADPGAGVPVWGFRSAEYRFAGEAPIPEPASVVLLGSGLAGLAVRRRKPRSIER